MLTDVIVTWLRSQSAFGLRAFVFTAVDSASFQWHDFCLAGHNIARECKSFSGSFFLDFCHRSCAFRDVIGQTMPCDLTWLHLNPINPLNVGQIVNNQTRGVFSAYKWQKRESERERARVPCMRHVCLCCSESGMPTRLTCCHLSLSQFVHEMINVMCCVFRTPLPLKTHTHVEVASNVEYQEIDIPQEWPVRVTRLLPNVFYQPRPHSHSGRP